MGSRGIVLGLCLLAIGGCLRRGIPDLDHSICCQAAQVIDPQPATTVTTAPAPEVTPPTTPQKDGKPPTLIDRLKLPPAMPGAQIPDIKLPPPDAPPKEKEAAIAKYFPALAAAPAEPRPAPGPTGAPLTLSDLQRLALTNNPHIKQAAADVEAARGVAIQAGLWPNPTIGYEGDDMGQLNGPGLQGGFIEQSIKTFGKPQLARDAALVDMRVAERKFLQVQSDVRTQVRAGYFNVLVAHKNLAVTRALTQLTDEVYKVLVLQLKAGEVAAYEPMQVRVLALQARGLLVQAHNRYLAAWKDLASSMGLPGMPLTELAGSIDMPIPAYHYDKLLAHVLSQHTEVLIAVDKVDKAQRALRLARVNALPDLDLRVLVQRDHTTPPFGVVPSVVLGMPLPVFDRNQGNIHQAEALLQQALEESHRVRADLTSRLALAFERYENNRALLDMYVRQMIPNQVQAFRAVVARHSRGDKGVSYNDLVTAEQTLVNVVTNYLSTLRDQWTAVVDVAGLLQTTDLFQFSDSEEALPVLDLEALLPLCCQHPCSRLRDPRLHGADGTWPAAVPPSPPESLPAPKVVPSDKMTSLPAPVPVPVPVPLPLSSENITVLPTPPAREPASGIEVIPLPPRPIGRPVLLPVRPQLGVTDSAPPDLPPVAP